MKSLCEDVFVSLMSLWTFLCLYMIIMLKRQDSGHIEFTRASYLYLCLCFFSSLCVFVWNQIVSVIFQSRERCNGIASTFLVPTGAALNWHSKYWFFYKYDILIWNTTIQNCNAINMRLGWAIKKSDKIRERENLWLLFISSCVGGQVLTNSFTLQFWWRYHCHTI